jgi:hypothetical protein
MGIKPAGFCRYTFDTVYLFATMDMLFYYTGKAVWLGLALLAVWLAIEIAVGFVTTISWARWVYCCAKKHGRALRWHRFPESFLRQWFEFIGYRNRGSVTLSRHEGGVWRGIGDWSVGSGPVEVAPFESETPSVPRG